MFIFMYRNFINLSGKFKLGDKCYVDVYIVICVLNIVCLLIVFLGNFLVFGVVWKIWILYKLMNLFVFGFVVFDLGVGVFI